MKEKIFRLRQATAALLSDQRNALLLTFPTDTGNEVKLEITISEVPRMLKALYFLAHAYGEIEPPSKMLKDVQPHEMTVLPAEEIEVRTRKEGGVWLASRIGSTDICLAIPDPRAAQMLGESLLREASKAG